MPLSWRFIISRNWRRLAPWRTCAEHLIHSSCCKTSALVSARTWLIPLWTTGLQGGVFIQLSLRWTGAAAGGASIPYQICRLSWTVWPPFTADGIVICNQSPLNAAHRNMSLSTPHLPFSPPISLSPLLQWYTFGFPFLSFPFLSFPFLSFPFLHCSNEWLWHQR